MGWNYDYQFFAVPHGAAYTFDTGVLNVRIADEPSGEIRQSPVATANRSTASIAQTGLSYSNWRFNLEVMLDQSTPALAYQARSEVLEYLTFLDGPLYLYRTAPFQGDVRIQVVPTRSPRLGRPRSRLIVPLETVSPLWEDQSLSYSAQNPVASIAISGDAPITDGSFTFSGQNGVQRLTNTTTGDWIELDADTTAQSIVVDVGAGTIRQNSVDVDDVFDANRPRWMHLYPNQTNNFTLTGGGSVTFSGRDKWH